MPLHTPSPAVSHVQLVGIEPWLAWMAALDTYMAVMPTSSFNNASMLALHEHFFYNIISELSSTVACRQGGVCDTWLAFYHRQPP